MSNGLLAGAIIADTVKSLPFLGSIADAMLGITPAERGLKYLAEANQPNIFPPPHSLIQAWRRGYLKDDKVLFQGLRSQGIAWGSIDDRGLTRACSTAWQAVGMLDVWIPSVDVAYDLYMRDIITKTQLDNIKERHAAKSNLNDVLMELKASRPSLYEVFTLLNREAISTEQATKYLKYLGYYYEEDRKPLLDLRKIIPGVSDQIHFLIRDAYDDATAARLGLDDELDRNPGFMFWSKRLGLDQMNYTDAVGNLASIDWRKMYWRSHFIMPSSAQAVTAQFRLRPDRLARYAQYFPDITTVTHDDVTAVQRGNDIIPKWRDRLAALAVPLIQIRQLRKGYNVGAIDKNQLQNRFKDEGYVNEDIDQLQKIYDEDKKEYKRTHDNALFGKERNSFTSQILESLDIGGITEADASTALNNVWDDNVKVQLAVNAIAIKKRNRYIKYYLAFIKKEFFLGLYNSDELYNQLKASGFTDEEARRWTDIFVRQLRVPRRIASTNTILDWYKRLFINKEDASTRLDKLGWSNHDILLWIAEADEDLDELNAKRAASAARTEEQKIRAAQRLIEQQNRVQAKGRSDFRRQYPLSSIETWYKYLLISENDARSLLSGHGLDSVNINLHIEEWNLEKRPAT